MTENETLENAIYGVVLTTGQSVGIVEVEPDEKVFDCARRAIDCEWIEVVEPAGLQGQDYVLLIDEESKLKGDVHFVNCIASSLYESPEHGDLIIGNAMIVKQDGEDLRLLTEDEALSLAKDMQAIRKASIHEMTEFLSNLKLAEKTPEKSISAILRMDSEREPRQPCTKEGLDR